MGIQHAKWQMLHFTGCGKACFYMTAKPEVGAVVEAQDCYKPDGTHPVVGEPFRCFSCGGLLAPEEVVIQYVAPYEHPPTKH